MILVLSGSQQKTLYLLTILWVNALGWGSRGFSGQMGKGLAGQVAGTGRCQVALLTSQGLPLPVAWAFLCMQPLPSRETAWPPPMRCHIPRRGETKLPGFWRPEVGGHS